MNRNVRQIGWAGFMVEDFSSAVNFFKDTLKLSLEKLYEEKQVAQFRLSSGQLFEIFGPKNRQRKEKYRLFNGISLGFDVENLDSIYESLAKKGVKFVTGVEKSSNDSWVMFLGPENRLLQIQQSKIRKPKSIAYVCLYASNLLESVRFYRDVLGLEPVNSNENPETSHFYAFNTGSTVLALERNGVRKNRLKTKSENPYLLQFRVDSKEELEQVNQRLEKNGIKLLDRSKKTGYGTITNFFDPDGNKLEFILI